MKKIVVLLIIILAVFSLSTGADRGSIPFTPGVSIFEPSQDALIAWNGEEQILILSTELYAAEETKVLQVLPLPSEPVVKESSRDLLRRANEYLFRHRLDQISQPVLRSSRSDIIPGGEVKQEIVIGSHDISVVEVLNQNEFLNWVNEHLRAKGENNPVIPANLQEIINNYIDRGYNYFVFDTIEVSQDAEFNEAIYYRFKSDHLYYPLEVTQNDHGVSDIRLIIVSDQDLINYTGLRPERVNILDDPAEINYGDLSYISTDLADLFFSSDRDEALKGNKVQIATWQIVDDLANFDQDLLVNSNLAALKENEMIYQGQRYVDVRKDSDYPYQSEKETAVLSGRVYREMGSRTHPWIGYGLNDKVLFSAKSRSFLTNFAALDEEVTVKGYSDSGTVLMRDPIDRMGILIEIDNAFFVAEIEGWTPYTGILMQEDGSTADERTTFWLENN